MWIVYVEYTDEYTYSFDYAYGFARTKIGAIKLENKAMIENPDKQVRIEKIQFIEDMEE